LFRFVVQFGEDIYILRQIHLHVFLETKQEGASFNSQFVF